MNQAKWVIDPTHSEMAFKVKHMMITTVSGKFDSFHAEVLTDGDDFNNARVSVDIDASSVNTGNKDRDAHLRSDDFFNAEAYPHIRFRSLSFDGNKMKGEISIRETTQVIELDVDFNGIVTDPYGQTKAGFELSGEIKRKEFGLMWDAVTEAGSVVVSDKVRLVIGAQFVKQVEAELETELTADHSEALPR